MQKLLDTKWHSQPTFAAFLEECTLDYQVVSSIGEVIQAQYKPTVALHTPSILKKLTNDLEHLRKELQRHLNVRKVGKSIYLAEFVTYIEALTQQQISWEQLAELVDAAQPESLKEKHVDTSGLRNNFKNFTDRNRKLYRIIRTEVGAYIAHCAGLPENKRPTFRRWSSDRLTTNQNNQSES
jgi:hypothetical protein